MAKINVEEHFGLVHEVANKWCRLVSHKYDYDDLFSEGLVGLVRAANNFDESKGVKFSTYAYVFIDGTIRMMTQRDKKYYARVYINKKCVYVEKQLELHLEQPVKVGDGAERDSTSWGDRIECRKKHIEKLEDKLYVEYLMSEAELSQKEKEILKMKYGQDVPQRVIGETLGISQVQVSRLLRKALAKLREIA